MLKKQQESKDEIICGTHKPHTNFVAARTHFVDLVTLQVSREYDWLYFLKKCSMLKIDKAQETNNPEDCVDSSK